MVINILLTTINFKQIQPHTSTPIKRKPHLIQGVKRSKLAPGLRLHATAAPPRGRVVGGGDHDGYRRGRRRGVMVCRHLEAPSRGSETRARARAQRAARVNPVGSEGCRARSFWKNKRG